MDVIPSDIGFKIDCKAVSSSINSGTGGRKDFSLLVLFTQWQLHCLEKIKNEELRNEYPKDQEKILFDKIIHQVKELKHGLILLDVEDLLFIRASLASYKVGGDVDFAKFLTQSLLLSYDSISEKVRGKMTIRTNKQILQKWKEDVQSFAQDTEIKIVMDSSTKAKLKEYLTVVRDTNSLYAIYSIIKDSKGFFGGIRKASLEEKRLVLQKLLHEIGEYTKNTDDTPSLSAEVSKDLENMGLPIDPLNKLRNLLAHPLTGPVLQFGEGEIEDFFQRGFLSIKAVIETVICKVERKFIQSVISRGELASSDRNLGNKLTIYLQENQIKGLIDYIDLIRSEKYYKSLPSEVKESVNEIYENAERMKSKGFDSGVGSLTTEREDQLKSEISSSITARVEEVIQISRREKLEDYNNLFVELIYSSQKLSVEDKRILIDAHNDLIKIMQAIGYLENGDFERDDFLKLEVLKKIMITPKKGGAPSSLKALLDEYFDAKLFKENLPQITEEFKDPKTKIGEYLKKIPDRNKIKKALTKMSLLGPKANPDDYKMFVDSLPSSKDYPSEGISEENKEKLLSYSLVLKKEHCIRLLKANVPALQGIYDGIIKNTLIHQQTYTDFDSQYAIKDGIKEKIKSFFSEQLNKQTKGLKEMNIPYAIQSSIINIFSIWEHAQNVLGVQEESVNLKKLRNFFSHGDALISDQGGKALGEQLLKLKTKIADVDFNINNFVKAFDCALSSFESGPIGEVLSYYRHSDPEPDSSKSSSKGALDFCARGGTSQRARRVARSAIKCLFSKDDVEKFTKGKLDENNVDGIIIDSKKFLTYIKHNQDEGKSAQLVKFIEDKRVEGDYKDLVYWVIQDQGHEHYMRNERINDLYGQVLHQNRRIAANAKLKIRLMNAASRIQLIRGIQATIASCKDGTAADCGFAVGGIVWSFASQPIEHVIVKTAPKIIVSGGKFVGKILPGAVGKQAEFAVTLVGLKVGSKVARGLAGAIGSVFDIIDITRSGNVLIDCKKREKSDSPCGDKEIRDAIVSMSISSVSFVAGVVLTAFGMPFVGAAVGVALMVGQAVYSGISNIIEYKKKYDTTSGENWSIFWRTVLFQPMASDVRHLAERKDIVNSIAKGLWEALNHASHNVVAYGAGIGKLVDGFLRPDYAAIEMEKRGNTERLSRVIPDPIEGADMICLPKRTDEDYEKGIYSSVPSAIYYCHNAIVIADARKSMLTNKTIVFDLSNVNSGVIIGLKEWINIFSIFEGSAQIIGNQDAVNRFVFIESSYAGNIRMGPNSTNVFDLSQVEGGIVEVSTSDSINSATETHRTSLRLKIGVDLCKFYFSNDVRYHYIGRQGKVDVVSCRVESECKCRGGCHATVDSGGGKSEKERDVISNCNRVLVWPYTDVTGKEDNYEFHIVSTGFKGEKLHSEINVLGTGTVIFPETDLLNDCDEITYSSQSNTLSLKIRLGQNNKYTLDIKNYRKKNAIEPNFILIDKNGSNIVPKIKHFGSGKITSFELYSAHSLDIFDDVETHHKKISSNNKGYDVLCVIMGKRQNDNELRKMVFGSMKDDVINLDQDTIFAKGGDGSDVYFVSGDTNCEKVTIDNSSNDGNLDAIHMPEIPKKFLKQGCDIYLSHNSTSIQVKNYLKDNKYRHVMLINNMGETFIPYIQSISCVESSNEHVRMVLFFHATPTQNMFLLTRDFEDNLVVIDSSLEEIERYKDNDDLLLVRGGEIPFVIKIEEFYCNPGRWENVNFLLWDNGNFSLYSDWYQEADGVMDYHDKHEYDYRKIVKEYVVDFTQSFDIMHNHDNNSTSVGQDEERIGIMILKDITPDRIHISRTDRDLVFTDKESSNVINIKNWSDSESYRISTLEFDLGLEPILVPGLDRFSLLDIAKIGSLVDKALELCQRNGICDTKVYAKDCYQQRSSYCVAVSGQLDAVEHLVRGLDDVNVKDSTSRTLLHYAAGSGRLDIAELLVKQSADVNVKDSIRQTPLHYAAFSGRLKVFEYLMGNGGNVSLRDENGMMPFHLAAKNGKLEVLQYLIGRKSEVDTWDKDRRTPLHLAAETGRLKVVEYLIGKGAKVNARDEYGRVPLHLAAKNGELEVVECLIRNRADVEASDKHEMTPLHLAAKNGRQHVVMYLAQETTDLDADDSTFRTPLHYAAEYGRQKTVEYLIGVGADLNLGDKLGITPLHLAAKNGDLEVVQALVLLWADVDAEDSSRRVPLHYAAEHGKQKVVEYLTAKGTKVHARDEFGRAPLHLAAKNGELEIVEFLTRKDTDVDLSDKHGMTPLHLAAGSVQLELVEYLIGKGANASARDEYGRTPLYLAAKNGRLEIVQYLVKGWGGVNVWDSSLQTPLHCAAENGKLTVVQYLIGKGAKLDARDSNGRIPLHLAAMNGKLEVVESLIRNGTSVDVRDDRDQTPVDLAIEEKHDNVVDVLEQRQAPMKDQPLERKRRHDLGDHSHYLSHKPLDQPEIPTSYSGRPSSWINDLFVRVKTYVGGFIGSQAALPEENLNIESSILQVDEQIDVNGTIMLLDLLIRKVTGQKYISAKDESISLPEAQGYALNITETLAKVVEQAGLKSGISMHRLKIDFFGMEKDITRKIMSGQCNEILGILKSNIERAYPGKEAGKLSQKKLDKFRAQFIKGLHVLLNQSVQEINGGGKWNVDSAKKQQMGLEPRIHLSNASIQGQLTQEKGKVGYNLIY